LVHLHSADGVADRVEENYTYYLYVMASSSRGKFPEFRGHHTQFGGFVGLGPGFLRWGMRARISSSRVTKPLLPVGRSALACIRISWPPFDPAGGRFLYNGELADFFLNAGGQA